MYRVCGKHCAKHFTYTTHLSLTYPMGYLIDYLILQMRKRVANRLNNIPTIVELLSSAAGLCIDQVLIECFQ